jgi:nickel transport protein
MKGWAKAWVIGSLGIALLGRPAPVGAQTPAGAEPQAVAALLQEQQRELTAELRRIQRELAALRADLEKPGLPEVMAGIGYICGLFGVAAFVAARRKR